MIMKQKKGSQATFAKQKVINLLKRKKMYEQQLGQYYNQGY